MLYTSTYDGNVSVAMNLVYKQYVYYIGNKISLIFLGMYYVW